jgi:hypothetical protein
MHVYCPECGALIDIFLAMDDADGRRWVDVLKGLPPVTIKPLVLYLRLFKPAKRKLTWSRMLKLTRELEPMIKAAQVTRNRNTYVATTQQWANAMTKLVEEPSPDLHLPLKGNGYLLGMLANMGEQQAAQQEQRSIESTRHRAREGSSEGPVQVGKVLDKAARKKKLPPKDWNPLKRSAPDA